jgi:hypothetical protein
LSLAQCTEDVANSCWAWNCNARHFCAKPSPQRVVRRCGIGCANATATAPPCSAHSSPSWPPPWCTFAQNSQRRRKDWLAKNGLSATTVGWRGCRCVPRDLRTLPTWLTLHAPRRTLQPLPPPTSPAIPSGDSLSLSLSFAEQSQCDGVAATCATAAAVAFANLQNAFRGAAAPWR